MQIRLLEGGREKKRREEEMLLGKGVGCGGTRFIAQSKSGHTLTKEGHKWMGELLPLTKPL